MESDRPILKSILSFRKRVSLRPYWYSYAAKRLMDTAVPVAAAIGLIFLSIVFAGQSLVLLLSMRLRVNA